MAGVITLLALQISNLAEDMSKMQEHVGQSVSKLKESISNTLGISPEKQQQMLKEQQSSGAGGGRQSGNCNNGFTNGHNGRYNPCFGLHFFTIVFTYAH